MNWVVSPDLRWGKERELLNEVQGMAFIFKVNCLALGVCLVHKLSKKWTGF